MGKWSWIIPVGPKCNHKKCRYPLDIENNRKHILPSEPSQDTHLTNIWILNQWN